MHSDLPALAAWRPGVRVLTLMALCLLPSCALAQVMDDPMISMPAPGVVGTATTPAGTTSTSQITTVTKFNITPDTAITTGVYYSPRFDVVVPLLLADTAITPHWSVETGYEYVRAQGEGVFLTEHILRLGALYSENFGPIHFDNRAAIEEVLIHGVDTPDVFRLRDRPRLTYNLDPESLFKPRVYTYAEPMFDTGTGRFSRVDYAAGFGFNLRKDITMDVFYVRETEPDMHVNDVNFVALQLVYFPQN
jgi:Protein of unknown function (DUF2490)